MKIRPFLVLLKALIVFVVINLAYAMINPSQAAFTLVNHLLPGFERFPVIRSLMTQPDGTISVQQYAITELDILFSNHEISGNPKSNDEYRVVLLGDSSMWGTGLSPQQTVAGIINQANLKTCSGQKVRAYSLAFPGHSAMKDLLIMNHSDAYNPDMFIWTVTLQTFVPEQQYKLVVENLDDYQTLFQRYKLDSSFKPNDSISENDFLDKTLWGQRGLIHRQLQIQGFSLSNYFFGTDDIRSSVWKNEDLVMRPTGNETTFNGKENNGNLFKNRRLLPFDAIRVASEISDGRPLLLINEPIFIETGKNSNVRYNYLYPRWAFDQFRAFMENLAANQNWAYRDYWDLLPKTEFLDTIYHRNAQGNLIFAGTLIPLILEYSCQQY